jgi:parallel beta-helix repeat protein
MSTTGGAVHFINSRNILIEDCQITRNNWFGLRLTQVNNVTTRRNSANYNGGAGWVGWKIKDLLSEGDETSYNNWRGVKGNFLGWEIAGLKHHSVHDAIYKSFKAIANHTRGFWLDYDNSNIVIQEGRLCGNTDGVNLEASEGPIIIIKSRIFRNNSYGITSDSSKVTLDGNTIYGNGNSQIKHAFANDRPVKNWETGEMLKIHGEDWTLRKNIIASDLPAALFELSGGDQFFSSLVLDGNIWHKADRKDPFRVGKRSMTVKEWETVTPGQKSAYPDPKQIGININDESCH